MELSESDKKIEAIREAVADYMRSEGCSCCQDYDGHKLHQKRLAELLDVPAHPNQADWHDFSPFESGKEKTNANN